MGLTSGSTFSDCLSHTGTCPKAQNRSTEENDVVILGSAEGSAFPFPEEVSWESGIWYLRAFPMKEAIDFFLIQKVRKKEIIGS